MRRLPFTPLLMALLLGGAPLPGAPDPGLKDTFQQAKAAWATQGDREGATAKFGALLAALEPAAATLDPAWTQLLCETYNWLAILEDRQPAKREKAPRHLENALALNPDFEIDRSITNTRLQGAFDALRAARYGRVALALEPAGGVLTLDGKARTLPPGPHYLPAGTHTFRYARLGFEPMEVRAELAPREARPVDLRLVRTSSVVTLFTSPAGAEVLLDGHSLGSTAGQAGPDQAAYAEQLGVRPDQVSAGFPIAGLAPGPHQLELRLACHQPLLLDLPEKLSTPFADHDLQPVLLKPSHSWLTVQSSAPGELFLCGKSYGPVPVRNLEVCAQTCELQVRFQAGTWQQRIELGEGRTVSLAVRPKPRLTYLGFEGDGEFAGRDRITGLLAGLGARLTRAAYATAAGNETPQACLARLQASHETELVLRARPVPGHPVHEVELVLSTLTGEEERLRVKPLESDPLGRLVARLETAPVLAEPWAGLTLVDLATGGPWVLQADAAAQKAGIRPSRPILQVNGNPAAGSAEVRKALAEAVASGTGKVTVSQGEAPVTLPVAAQPVELPVNAAGLCYPMVLADLRLRALGAGGEEAGLLRLQQALALMHFREYDQALVLLRDARLASVQGVSQGTLDYYTGLCLLHMGDAYLTEAQQSFNQALKYPHATLFGPGGPFLAPLAKQALEDLKP